MTHLKLQKNIKMWLPTSTSLTYQCAAE